MHQQIDVIVTAYNVQDCLGECLASLAAQTYENFRVLVIEDSSTDQTAEVASEFVARDARFEMLSTPGLGAAGARNRGLALVEAPLFMLLDGDDIFHPELLQRLRTALTSTDADIAVCDMVQFVHDPALSHEARMRIAAPWSLKKSQLPDLSQQPWVNWQTIPGNLFAAFMGWPWDKLYRTEFIRQHDLAFPEDLTNSEDMLFTYEALVLADRIAVVDEVLIDHRIERTGSVSNSRTTEPLAFYEALRRMKAFLLAQPAATPAESSAATRTGASSSRAAATQPATLWNALQKPFLNWAFDWTLWNIETLGAGDAQSKLIGMLYACELDLLELDQHEPAYFTEYPRSMARYASLLDDEASRAAASSVAAATTAAAASADTRTLDPDAGPLGAPNALPYGAFKPWSQANFLEKVQIKRRMRQNIPSEW